MCVDGQDLGQRSCLATTKLRSNSDAACPETHGDYIMLVLFYLSEGSKSIWDDVLLFVLAAAIAAGMLALFMVPDYLFYQKRRNSIPTSDASHIQVDTEAEAVKLLEIIKEGSLEEEYQRFCTVCRVHSKCDSKVDDGYLGTILFGELELPTALVDACFYEKVWSTVGPVKTEYGYHLVFIRQRTDPEKVLEGIMDRRAGKAQVDTTKVDPVKKKNKGI